MKSSAILAAKWFAVPLITRS